MGKIQSIFPADRASALAGLSSGRSGDSVARRVAVFIDWQNCYKAARQAFHDDEHDPAYIGNVRPEALASLLASKGPGAYSLVHVGVYCGIADSTRDPKTFAARRRQIAGWQKTGVSVFARPLRYPPPWAMKQGEKAREKGVDVKLALDAVVMAIEDRYDVGIIASCDTDLDALVEALFETQVTLGRKLAIEAIAWKGRENKLKPVEGLTFRWIGDRDYNAIRDLTDYNVASRP